MSDPKQHDTSTLSSCRSHPTLPRDIGHGPLAVFFFSDNKSLTNNKVGMAFCLSAIIFFIWRHRKRRQGEGGDAANGSTVSLVKIVPGGLSEKPELDSKEVLNSPVPSELQGTRDAAEMPVPHFVAELPGSMPAGYQPGIERSLTGTARGRSGDGGRTPGTEEHKRQGARSIDDLDGGGYCRRRSILRGQPSLERTISSPSTPSGESTWRDVSSVESFGSPILPRR